MADELVSVLVPRGRVLEVYALLARPPITLPALSEPVAGPVTWDKALVERMYRESPDAMKKLLDYLVDADGRHVPADELAAAIGYTRPQLAGVLGAFGRRSKNRYGQAHWPFRADNPPEAGMWCYWMEPAYIVILRAMRND